MTRDSDFPDYADYDRRVTDLIRKLGDLEQRHYRLRDRVRNLEENVRKVETDCAEWGPIIETARDQEYLRKWVEKQERREDQRHEWRWSHVAVVIAACGMVLGGIQVIVTIVLRATGHS